MIPIKIRKSRRHRGRKHNIHKREKRPIDLHTHRITYVLKGYSFLEKAALRIAVFQGKKAFDSKLSVVHGWCGSVIKWNGNVEYFPLCLKSPNKFPDVKPSYCTLCQLPEHNQKGKEFFLRFA